MDNCAWFGAVSGDGLQRERRIGERALLCCLAENWTEERQLQRGCPHKDTTTNVNALLIGFENGATVNILCKVTHA